MGVFRLKGQLKQDYSTIFHVARRFRLLGPVPVALAHPAEAPGLEKMLPSMVETGLAGMEVHYGLYPAEERAVYQKLADTHGLLATGGSDYHGPGRAAECDLGGLTPPLA